MIISAILVGISGDGTPREGKTKPICGNGIIEPKEKDCCQDLGCPIGEFCISKDNSTYECTAATKEENIAYQDFKRLATTLISSVYTTTSPEAVFSKNQISSRLEELKTAGYDVEVEEQVFAVIIDHLDTITEVNKFNQNISSYLSNEEIKEVYFNGADPENVSIEITAIKYLADQAISIITTQEVRISLLRDDEKRLLEELGFNVAEELESYAILKQSFQDTREQLP